MNQFIFKDKVHENTFHELRSVLPENYRSKGEYLSVLYLMTGNTMLGRKVSPYFDLIQGEFHYLAMFEHEDFSDDIRNIWIAKLAVHLFSNKEVVMPLDLIKVLSDDNFELCLQAMRVRRFDIDAAYQSSEGVSH